MLNSNQLEQSAVVGNLDLQVNDGGVFNGKLSDDESGTGKPGDRVKLDDSSTGKFPTFLLAADGDVAFGTIVRTVQQSEYVAGQKIQVASAHRGPVQFFVASTEVKPGETVTLASSKINVQDGSEKTLGIALDYFSGNNAIGRVILA